MSSTNMYMPQKEWDAMSQSLCSIFDIEYQPSISESIVVESFKFSYFNTKGLKHTEQTKKIISESKIGKKQSEAHIKRLSEVRTGRAITPEQKKKISEALKGRPTWNKGIPMTEESKNKLLKSNIGRPNTPEQKKKISEALKGRVFSIEHKRKISEAAKARYDRKKQEKYENS